MRRDEALHRLRESKAELNRLGVAHLSIYGSVARDQAGPASDVDLVVDSSDGAPLGLFKLADISDALERVLERPVDVISRSGLENTSRLRSRAAADIVDVF